MSRMKNLAWSYVWLPGLDWNIEEIAIGCTSCKAVKDMLAVAPLHPWSWPAKAWQRVQIDFASPFQLKSYLIMVDAHSKWPGVFKMVSTMAGGTITVLWHVFASHGLPLSLALDNGHSLLQKNWGSTWQRTEYAHSLCLLYTTQLLAAWLNVLSRPSKQPCMCMWHNKKVFP